MFSDNFKRLRKSGGLSQEELAIKLSVVRQTVSKWENGLSVPDSEMLIRIAEALDTTVNVLLGEEITVGEESELKAISVKLEILNEQIAKRNERNRKIWRAVFIAVAVVVTVSLAFNIFEYFHFRFAVEDINSDTAIIGGFDGPTNVFVSSIALNFGGIILALALLALSLAGIYKTRRK